MLTDIASVLPLLRRNYETNLSPAVLRGELLPAAMQAGTLPGQLARTPFVALRMCSCPRIACPLQCHFAAATGDAVHAEAAGRVRVAELDWSQPSHFTGGGEGGAGVVEPPYDYILAGGHTEKGTHNRAAGGACCASLVLRDFEQSHRCTSGLGPLHAQPVCIPPPPPPRSGLHLPRAPGAPPVPRHAGAVHGADHHPHRK